MRDHNACPNHDHSNNRSRLAACEQGWVWLYIKQANHVVNARRIATTTRTAPPASSVFSGHPRRIRCRVVLPLDTIKAHQALIMIVVTTRPKQPPLTPQRLLNQARCARTSARTRLTRVHVPHGGCWVTSPRRHARHSGRRSQALLLVGGMSSFRLHFATHR